MNLDGSKATPNGDISVNILKSTVDIQLAEVVPIFMKKDYLENQNYMHLSILPHVSQIFDRTMYYQIKHFMQINYQNNHYSTQNLQYTTLFPFKLENGKKILDQEGCTYAVFKYMSKAFET